MSLYNPFGPRDGEYMTYQKLKWISNNLSHPSNDKVEEHSVVLTKIWKWTSIAHNLRVQDCENRRSEQYRKNVAREAAIRADAERTEKMNVTLEEAQAVSIKMVTDYYSNFRRMKQRLMRNTQNLTRSKNQKKLKRAPSLRNLANVLSSTWRNSRSCSTSNSRRSKSLSQSSTISTRTTTSSGKTQPPKTRRDEQAPLLDEYRRKKLGRLPSSNTARALSRRGAIKHTRCLICEIGISCSLLNCNYK